MLLQMQTDQHFVKSLQTAAFTLIPFNSLHLQTSSLLVNVLIYGLLLRDSHIRGREDVLFSLLTPII